MRGVDEIEPMGLQIRGTLRFRPREPHARSVYTQRSGVNTAGFSATQFQSIATHPMDPNFTIGGTQDNGTNFYQPSATWTRADYGDDRVFVQLRLDADSNGAAEEPRSTA